MIKKPDSTTHLGQESMVESICAQPIVRLLFGLFGRRNGQKTTQSGESSVAAGRGTFAGIESEKTFGR